MGHSAHFEKPPSSSSSVVLDRPTVHRHIRGVRLESDDLGVGKQPEDPCAEQADVCTDVRHLERASLPLGKARQDRVGEAVLVL